MKPLALLAGGILSLTAMGIAQAQTQTPTLNLTLPAAPLNTPLILPAPSPATAMTLRDLPSPLGNPAYAPGLTVDVVPAAPSSMSGGGATLRIMTPARDAQVVEKLKSMGVEDGARYGDQGRFYLFAATSGRAVGMNMVPGAGSGGWSTDPTAFVGDAQAGVGWRKGGLQTSLGYVVRGVRVADKYAQRFVDLPSNEQVTGISISYRPSR